MACDGPTRYDPIRAASSRRCATASIRETLRASRRYERRRRAEASLGEEALQGVPRESHRCRSPGATSPPPRRGARARGTTPSSGAVEACVVRTSSFAPSSSSSATRLLGSRLRGEIRLRTRGGGRTTGLVRRASGRPSSFPPRGRRRRRHRKQSRRNIPGRRARSSPGSRRSSPPTVGGSRRPSPLKKGGAVVSHHLDQQHPRDAGSARIAASRRRLLLSSGSLRRARRRRCASDMPSLPCSSVSIGPGLTAALGQPWPPLGPGQGGQRDLGGEVLRQSLQLIEGGDHARRRHDAVSELDPNMRGCVDSLIGASPCR